MSTASGIPVLPLRQLRESDSELAEEKSCKGAENNSTEAVEDAAVALLLRRLGLHDIDGLNGDVVVLIVGHDLFLSLCWS
jgi:hypothetical protein